jgi:L-lactate dehydrogenase complex protein LldF
MGTSVPDVHIAITGIEKVVELLSDVPPRYSLLTRSATGQPGTTYPGPIGAIISPHLLGLDDTKGLHLAGHAPARLHAQAATGLDGAPHCAQAGAADLA